jgi:hypothetical protein
MMMLAKQVVFVVILLNIQVMFVIVSVKSEELNPTIHQVKEQNMTNNFKCLNEAREKIKKYDTGELNGWPAKASGWLADANDALNEINLTIENNITTRSQVRDSKLMMQLQMIALLDRDINPSFDWKHAPEPVMGSIVTDDPEFRAAYDKKIKENNALAAYAYRQRGLSLVNKGISEDTKKIHPKRLHLFPPRPTLPAH